MIFNFFCFMMTTIAGCIAIYYGPYQGNYAQGCWWLLVALIIDRTMQWNLLKKLIDEIN